MSIFSETLSEYIQKKNIKVSSLVRYCDTDRSTMYKIINGKRNPPSRSLFQKIAVFLHLTPVEYQHLEEAWKITRTGHEIYYRRKSVENFISSFPSSAPVILPRQVDFHPAFSNLASDREAAPLTSQQQINFALHCLILAEASSKQGKIGLFLQPDHNFLFSLLSSLNPSGSLTIQHLLCFSSNDRFTYQHELYNLRCLKDIFPFCMAGLDYSPRFFYDDIQSHYYNFNVFPCLILTSKSALMCSSDYQTGIIYHQQDIVNLFWKQYQSFYDKCSPLFRTVSMDPETSEDFFDILLDTAEDDTTFIIQPEACLTPFITDRILDECFNHSLPQGKTIQALASKTFAGNLKKIQQGHFFLYFTEIGIQHFAHTGIIDEIPEIYYRPFTPNQRSALLQGVLTCCRSGAYRILKKPLNHIPENFRLCVRSNQCTITFQDNDNKIQILSILESGLADTFRDYLESMEESAFYSNEKSVGFIQKIIECIKEEEL